MNNAYPKKWRSAVTIFLVVSFICAAGCEPLRKKFIRKKKNEEQTQVTAILDPIEYPGTIKTIGNIYEERYAIWKVWQDELETNLINNANDKKIRSTIRQIKEQLTALRLLLQEDARPGMDPFFVRLDRLDNIFDNSPDLRNKDLVLSRVRALGKDIKNQYAPRKISGLLKVR